MVLTEDDMIVFSNLSTFQGEEKAEDLERESGAGGDVTAGIREHNQRIFLLKTISYHC